MWKKIALVLLILTFLLPFGLAELEVEQMEEIALDCDVDVVEDKTYIARTELIHVGLWCADTAYIRMYECLDSTCEEKGYLATATKSNGDLAIVTGFDVGVKYNYECYECVVEPTLELEDTTIIVEEGERVELEASCVDSKGRVGSIDYSGWMISSLKLTGYEDAGEYSVRVTCTDQNGHDSTEEVIVTVEDINRPPTVHAVLKE